MSSLRQLTRRTAVLSQRPYGRISPQFVRLYAREKRPYDPNEDPTPRRKYVFGAAAMIALAVGIISSMNKSVRADSESYVKDPATDVEFPKTLKLPGTPELTLLGLGVRTVSFLGIRVYSVGFYADLNRPDLRVEGTPEERIEAILRQTTCGLRIVPIRSTSHTHLRDGFVRSIQSRITDARQRGYLTTEQEDALVQPMQTMKGLFPNVSLPKHKPLHAVLTGPEPGSSTRTLIFPELGRVDNPWMAQEFFLAYFSGQGISPAMKKSVEDAVAQLGTKLRS